MSPRACTLEETPIIRDMRQTARDLGIVRRLLQVQRDLLHGQTADVYDQVEEVLILLGVSNHELLDNLSADPRPPAVATAIALPGKRPRP